MDRTHETRITPGMTRSPLWWYRWARGSYGRRDALRIAWHGARGNIESVRVEEVSA